MRRHLLSTPLLIITLVIGLYITPYNATSGIRGVLTSFARAIRDDMRPSYSNYVMASYFGRWGGSGDPVIEIGSDRITDVQLDRSYSYRVIGRSNHGRTFLIEVLDYEGNSNLRRFMNLSFENPQWLAVFGYDSEEAYNVGAASLSGSFANMSSPKTR